MNAYYTSQLIDTLDNANTIINQLRDIPLSSHRLMVMLRMHNIGYPFNKSRFPDMFIRLFYTTDDASASEVASLFTQIFGETIRCSEATCQNHRPMLIMDVLCEDLKLTHSYEEETRIANLIASFSEHGHHNIEWYSTSALCELFDFRLWIVPFQSILDPTRNIDTNGSSLNRIAPLNVAVNESDYASELMLEESYAISQASDDEDLDSDFTIASIDSDHEDDDDDADDSDDDDEDLMWPISFTPAAFTVSNLRGIDFNVTEYSSEESDMSDDESDINDVESDMSDDENFPKIHILG